MKNENELLEKYFQMVENQQKALDMLEKALEEKERNLFRGFLLVGLGISLLVNSTIIAIKETTLISVIGSIFGGLFLALGFYYATKPIRLKRIQ
ncbi:MAG: hypothetical protein H0Z18_04855 [Thermococcus sp.]|uniref:hypothetical protein n=1 Tax=Thermococcus sp. TaxID=35749 RepID=UPI001DF27C3A|nr:hypothetical protein [Thermococcus sp.]MBO8174568.1 hypothetical protein [Thermococcus sp.]